MPGKTEILELEKVVCELPLMNAYIKEENILNQLAFINFRGGSTEQFTAETHEVTHGQGNKILIHRISSVLEVEKVTRTINQAIQKVIEYRDSK